MSSKENTLLLWELPAELQRNARVFPCNVPSELYLGYFVGLEGVNRA